MKRLLTILILCAAGLSAQTKPQPKSQSSVNWERMKDCAAQTERMMHRDVVMSKYRQLLRNHYSPKYERCFVLTATDDGNLLILYDALENVDIAQYGIGPAYSNDSNGCHVMLPGTTNAIKVRPCPEVDLYIAERLNE
jgi:hypothetical protein